MSYLINSSQFILRKISKRKPKLSVYYTLLNPSPEPDEYPTVNTSTSYLFQIHFNSLLLSITRSPKWSLPFKISSVRFVCSCFSTLTSTLHISILLDLINLEQIFQTFGNREPPVVRGPQFDKQCSRNTQV
jgi:hypothetical protein